AAADLHLYRFAVIVSGLETAKLALLHQALNWFTFYCCPRTLANCLEWCLTMIALSQYPWLDVCGKSPSIRSSRSPMWFIFVAIGCVVLRPTAAVTWIPLCLLHLFRVLGKNDLKLAKSANSFSSPFGKLLKTYCFVGILWLALSCLADRWAFGRWTVDQWNFFRFNFLTGGSQAYGVHPWHWYLSQGIMAILWTQTPLVLIGALVDGSQTDWANDQRFVFRRRVTILLIFVGTWTVFCYRYLPTTGILFYMFCSTDRLSLVYQLVICPHKEFRFLFPLLPLGAYFSARATLYLAQRFSSTAQGSVRLIRLVLILIAVTHIPVALYTCLIHQRGPIDTVSALRKAIQRRFPTNREILSENVSILALMPCHTLPPVSFIHLNVSFKQLNCDPDLSLWFDGQRRVHYDEADEFYDNPARWLNERFDGLKRTSSRKPTFITLFDHLFDAHPSLKNLLLHVWGYRECGRFFHAHFLTHRRYGRYIYILCHAF
ncbi:plasmid Maintenance Protein, partial [Opisthorchis viverrini]